MCPSVEDIICSSHSGALAAECFVCPIAKKYISYWSYLVTTSNIAKQLFKLELDKNPYRKSKVRWCAEFDVSKEIAIAYPIVKNIIMREDIQFGEGIRDSMRTLINNDEQILRTELAVLLDAGDILYNFIYKFEGDGLLTPYIFGYKQQVIESLCFIIVNNHMNCPNITAVCNEYSNGDLNLRDNLINNACEKIRPVLTKFQSMFHNNGGKLTRMMQIYSGLSLVLPYQFSISTNERRIQAVQDIMLLEPFQTADYLNFEDDLLHEIPQYTVESNGVASDINVFDWWREHKARLPNWFRVFGESVILQPSSGCSERIFAMLRWMFGENQENALEDNKETSIMLRFNELQRNKIH